MADNIIENHYVSAMEHEMRKKGCHLKEIKKKIDSFLRLDKKTVFVHVRTIEDDRHGIRSFKVTEHLINDITGNRFEETDMTSYKVTEFEKDWKKLWHQKMTQGESATLQ
jgi:hypothetical protein